MKTNILTSLKILLSMGILLTASTFSLAQPKKASVTSKAVSEKMNYLMVQASHTAEFTYNEKTNTYQVVLKEVAPFVAYFSDRPDRKAGSMPITEYLKLWEKKGKNSFWSDPPNADIHAMDLISSAAEINFPVELSNPKYDAKTRTLSYTAKALKGADLLPNGSKVEHVLLFIDDVCLSCW